MDPRTQSSSRLNERLLQQINEKSRAEAVKWKIPPKTDFLPTSSFISKRQESLTREREAKKKLTESILQTSRPASKSPTLTPPEPSSFSILPELSMYKKKMANSNRRAWLEPNYQRVTRTVRVTAHASQEQSGAVSTNAADLPRFHAISFKDSVPKLKTESAPAHEALARNEGPVTTNKNPSFAGRTRIIDVLDYSAVNGEPVGSRSTLENSFDSTKKQPGSSQETQSKKRGDAVEPEREYGAPPKSQLKKATNESAMLIRNSNVTAATSALKGHEGPNDDFIKVEVPAIKLEK